MEFDLRSLPPAARYKILAGSITPRPIAWVTTLSKNGTVNAAPYSFFNMMGDEPPTLVLGMLERPGGGDKDTAANVLATGEFVVNLVSEDQGETMNVTSMDAPVGVDELACAGVATKSSSVVAPPRISASPASFECRALQTIRTGTRQLIIVGEVLIAHLADEFVLDHEKFHIDAPAMKLIARMHGAGWYARSTDRFQLERPVYADWLARNR